MPTPKLMADSNQRHLATYLQDHFGGAVGGGQLADHIVEANRDNDVGARMAPIARDVHAARGDLEAVMHHLDVAPSTVKNTLAFVGERVSRVLRGGNPLPYDDVDRLLELESMQLGVEGQIRLWRLLQELESAGVEVIPPGGDVPPLSAQLSRAERMRDQLEELRLHAARVAMLPDQLSDQRPEG